MNKRSATKGALEMSISTIIIIVIGVTMLILGMVLVRNIMCGAMGLTTDVNTKVTGELNKLFGSTEGEVACIGSGQDAVSLLPNKESIIYCAIKAPQKAQYAVTLKQSGSTISSLTDSVLQKWIKTSQWSGMVSPGDTSPKKVLRIDIPDNAPEGNVQFQVEITRDGELISTQDLDFQITRAGFVKSAVC